MKKLYFITICAAGFIAIIGCLPEKNNIPPAGGITSPADTNSETAVKTSDTKLVFSLHLNQKVYEDTDYGEAPQLAIWLEDANGSKIQTVWVTYRSGTGDWTGKIDCPVALPYWVSRYNKETHTSGPPTFRKPVADAMTGPTPKLTFAVQKDVPYRSRWKYFVEVNASGDYNADFPSQKPDGEPDPQGNGQPSLIYQGEIEAVNNAQDTPKLIGRTDQWQAIDYIIPDLKGITTAKNLFSKIEVCCQSSR